MRNEQVWERLRREHSDGVEQGLASLQQQHGISRDDAVKMVNDRMDRAASRQILTGWLWVALGVLILVVILL